MIILLASESKVWILFFIDHLYIGHSTGNQSITFPSCYKVNLSSLVFSAVLTHGRPLDKASLGATICFLGALTLGQNMEYQYKEKQKPISVT